MSPVVIDATYRNIGTEPIDLYWFNCPRFQVLTSDGREFQKTDFAVSQEAAENRYYEKANFTAFMGLPDPIKPGEKFTMGWTLNDWSDLTAAGTSNGKIGGNQKLKVHCQEFGVDSSEVEIQISSACAYKICD